MPYEERTKGVIKCYFIMNKGKWVTAKQINEFIQEHRDLRLGKYGRGLSPMKISNLLKKNYFRDLQVKRENTNRKLYCYKGGDKKWQ